MIFWDHSWYHSASDHPWWQFTVCRPSTMTIYSVQTITDDDSSKLDIRLLHFPSVNNTISGKGGPLGKMRVRRSEPVSPFNLWPHLFLPTPLLLHVRRNQYEYTGFTYFLYWLLIAAVILILSTCLSAVYTYSLLVRYVQLLCPRVHARVHRRRYRVLCAIALGNL